MIVDKNLINLIKSLFIFSGNYSEMTICYWVYFQYWHYPVGLEIITSDYMSFGKVVNSYGKIKEIFQKF